MAKPAGTALRAVVLLAASLPFLRVRVARCDRGGHPPRGDRGGHPPRGDYRQADASVWQTISAGVLVIITDCASKSS
jgi:hypothetical protein